MAVLRIKYVQAFTDPWGHQRLYFRRKGYKKVSLRGPVGSAEFNEDYALALKAPKIGKDLGAKLTKAGSISDLLVQYYDSMNFAQLRPSTQENYKRILEKFRADHGDKSVRNIERKHIHAMMDAKRATPGAAYSFLKRIKTVFDFGIERGFRTDNPAFHVKGPKLKGFRPLTDTDIDAYFKFWPMGSIQSRAMAVLLYTGQRRSDAVRMGLQHVREGRIAVTQEKTGARLQIPIHARLQAEIDMMPAGQLMFITGVNGKPLVSESFGNMFGEWCESAGLPHDSSPHGVRKAAGCLGPNGYIRIEIVHRPYYAHRLIWAWNFGEICEGLNIDHADGIRSNNRLKNLKLVPQAMNLRNQGKRSDNTSGFKGVFWYPRDNNWRAIPRVNGESYRLGSFDRLEDAALAVADFYRKNGFTERHIGQANAQEAS